MIDGVGAFVRDHRQHRILAALALVVVEIDGDAMIVPSLGEDAAEDHDRIGRIVRVDGGVPFRGRDVEETPHLRIADRGGRNGQRVDAVGQLGRIDGVRRLFDRHVVEDAVRRGRRPRRPPAGDEGLASEGVGDVPDRGNAARVGVDRRVVRAVHEVDDAVAVRREAGGDGGPDHRRDGRLNSLQRSGDPACGQRFHIRNAAIVGELVEQFPISAVDREDDHARRRAARVAPQLGAFRAEERLFVRFESRHFECSDFQSAARKVIGDGPPQRIALRVER